ncbi:acyltransferase [Amycolatopsis antarctica]|uniref:Acyltransferase n=1 Tax=Amycolatopsis antarctica TaxID=1854586 RepID=A0A263D1B1_9PSEU|nr:acyltransferase [Amycolatopsis antarctica]OZM71898.1 acyltransferase [Amycolatopsis antarctica]
MTTPVVAAGRDARAGGTKRDGRLEGLRGYLAMAVVVYHVAFQAGTASFMEESTRSFWTTAIDGLSACLPPFFVLSGFFLYRPFARAILGGTPKPAVRPFLWQRVVRLMPAYVLVAVVALLTLNFYAIDGFWYVARPFLLFHFYWPDVPWVTGIDQTWTVPAELLFYLILPAFAILVTRFARGAVDAASRTRRMLVPLLLFVVAGFAWTIFTNLPATQEIVTSFNMWYWPFGYFDAFAVGMALATVSAYAQVTGRTPRFFQVVARHPNLWWLGALAAYLLNMPRLFGTPGVGNYLGQELTIHVLVLVFSACLVIPLTVPGVRSRLMDGTLDNPPMRFLGRISYGIYLWHLIPITLWLEQGNLFGNVPLSSPELRGTIGFWALLIPTVIGTVIAAALSYYLLERPIARWARRRQDRRAPRSVPVTEITEITEAARPVPERTPV